MTSENKLIQEFASHANKRRYTRRQVIRAGAALGLSAAAVSSVLAMPAFAQDSAASPAADGPVMVPIVGKEMSFDEIKAAGLGDAQLADAAVQAASWKSIGSGAYASTPVTADGRSATDATSDWALAAVSDITGKALPGLGGTTAQTLPNVTPSVPAFDAGAVSSALSLIGGL